MGEFFYFILLHIILLYFRQQSVELAEGHEKVCVLGRNVSGHEMRYPHYV